MGYPMGYPMLLETLTRDFDLRLGTRNVKQETIQRHFEIRNRRCVYFDPQFLQVETATCRSTTKSTPTPSGKGRRGRSLQPNRHRQNEVVPDMGDALTWTLHKRRGSVIFAPVLPSLPVLHTFRIPAHRSCSGVIALVGRYRLCGIS